MHHQLKTNPNAFAATKAGLKPFEIRKDDRFFQKGDTVTLQEYDNSIRGAFDHVRYTGEELEVEITFVTGFQQQDGYVVFGHKPASAKQ